MSKRLGIQGMLILWIIFFLRSVLRALHFLIDYDEVRTKSQPKEEVSRSAIYIISINGILAFCSYVIMDSQKPILGWYYSSKTYIHAIWIHFFNKSLRKTQISLGIRPVWLESLLCAQWVAKGSVLLQAGSEDSDQTGRMHRLIWVFAGRTVKIHGNRNQGYMEGTYRQHIFMIFIPDERA